MTDADAETRRQERANWPAKLVRLGEEDEAGEMPGSTLEERFAVMWQLALQVSAAHGDEIFEPGLPRRIARLVRREG